MYDESGLDRRYGPGMTDGSKAVVNELPSSQSSAAPGWPVPADVISELVGEIRGLIEHLEQADPRRSEGSAMADLESVMSRLLFHLEALPERIAEAITDALARQHQMIMDDLRSTLQELAIS